ncbi:sigma-70 factor domain-containing protein [Janibacter anophelis]|uniref:sigma-70 factor domain-containing protein n=1 Tax=Janibacter anophelis TaxID=319054 RepID=UPI003F81DFFE
MTDMVIRPATQTAKVSDLPSSIDIDAEISALETHLARLHAARAKREVQDAEPWVLDHADDDWQDSPAVGASAFARRALPVSLLTAEDETALARRIEAGAFARQRLSSAWS